jgi:hypothetical protein
MNSHTHDHTPAPDAGDAMPSYYEIMETSGLLRGCLTEKKSLVKIGEPSHMSTRFFATRFFQMPARGRGGKSEGAKKHLPFPDGDPRTQSEWSASLSWRDHKRLGGYQGNRGGPPPGGVGRASALPSNLPLRPWPARPAAVRRSWRLGSGGSEHRYPTHRATTVVFMWAQWFLNDCAAAFWVRFQSNEGVALCTPQAAQPGPQASPSLRSTQRSRLVAYQPISSKAANTPSILLNYVAPSRQPRRY